MSTKFTLVFVLSALFSFSNPRTSKEVLKKMHERYGGKWFPTFTFRQTTENFRNDSLIKTSVWHEAIIYPDKFRIDFGDIKNGNAVIFRKDSAYHFNNDILRKVTVNNNDLTFLLGGMYFYPFDSVVSKLTHLGYNLGHFYEDKFNGKPVYIVGANNASEKLNQLWIDKEKLLLVRFIKFEEGNKEEGIFENHRPFGNGWSETSCTFYVNDKLIQKETYHNCKAGEYIDPGVFEPALFGTVHWSVPH